MFLFDFLWGVLVDLYFVCGLGHLLLLGFFLYFSGGGGLGDVEELFIVDLGVFEELKGILMKLFLTDLVSHLENLTVE